MLLFTYSDKVKVKNNQSFSFRRLLSGKPYLLWWYGAAVKSSNPLEHHLQVVFREILNQTDEGLELGAFKKEHLPLPLLSAYRIGSIWQDGRSAEAIHYPVQEFKISFAEGHWRHKSFNAQYKSHIPNDPYTVDLYPLPYEDCDLSPLLEFDLDTGGKLVLNSMDFFRAAYGHSVELKRILTTYPYNCSDSNQESIVSLLLPDVPNGPVTQGWEVLAPSRKIAKHDAVFLAHLIYDEHTQRVVKKLSNQVVKGFLNTSHYSGGGYSFLAVEPWHTDTDVTIRVQGIPFDNDKSFLGLNILGISDPHGQDVTWLYKNAVGNAKRSSKVDDHVVITRQVSPSPLKVASTFSPAWDGEEAVLRIDAQTVGNQRTVTTFKGQDTASTKTTTMGQQVDSYSSAPPKSSGHGVGGIVAKVVAEKPPRFELMWQEASDLLVKGVLSQVQWYDGKKFHSTLPLECIELESKNGKVPFVARAFVMKLTLSDGREFGCIELAGRSGREIFTGLLAEITPDKPFFVWVRWILHEVSKHRGVFNKFIKKSVYAHYKVYKHGNEEHATLERVLKGLE